MVFCYALNLDKIIIRHVLDYLLELPAVIDPIFQEEVTKLSVIYVLRKSGTSSLIFLASHYVYVISVRDLSIDIESFEHLLQYLLGVIFN